jgi:hypothetical protein
MPSQAYDERNPPPADTFDFHPLANLFPLLDDEALAALVADIKAHGLRRNMPPIVMFEGAVLDGRNRVIASRRAGKTIPPSRIVQFQGSTEEAKEFVIAANILRRHLKTGQRALAALDLVTTKHGGDRSDQERNPALALTYEDAAKRAGVSVDSIKLAAAVRAHAEPKVVEAVRRGEMSLNAAYETVRPEVEAEPETEEVEPPGDAANVVVDLDKKRAANRKPLERKTGANGSAVKAEPALPKNDVLAPTIAQTIMFAQDKGIDLVTLIVRLIDHVKLDDGVGLKRIDDAIVARLDLLTRGDAQEEVEG